MYCKAEAPAIEVNISIPDMNCVLVGGGVSDMAGSPQQGLDERIKSHTEALSVVCTQDEPEKCVVDTAGYAWRRGGAADEIHGWAKTSYS
ncbi:MAG: hypothetical protein K6E38_07160 [Fretibacterium sp.]|nr:hypothetical protein [Fretibacterium sp.]